jgi:hypothetical protein
VIRDKLYGFSVRSRDKTRTWSIHSDAIGMDIALAPHRRRAKVAGAPRDGASPGRWAAIGPLAVRWKTLEGYQLLSTPVRPGKRPSALAAGK